MPILAATALAVYVQSRASLNARLVDAVRHNDLTAAKRLLDAGADANFRAASQEPLIVAVFRAPTSYRATGSLEPLVRLLLDRGAKADVFDAFGWTPLTLAPGNISLGLAQMLLDRGADPNRVAMHGDPALNRFASAGRLDLVRLLIDRGARVDAEGYFGLTAFDEAARAGNRDIMRFLISEPGRQRLRFDRAFFYAAQSDRDNSETLNFLLSLGQRPSVRLPDGRTPLHFAAEWGHPANVRWLLAHGVDPKLRDRQGYTPWNLAVRAQTVSKVDRSAVIRILARG